MSQFYGTVQGQRGEATRCGHSEIRASAQSYVGSIITRLWTENHVTYCSIIAAEGSSSHCGGYTLYFGPIIDLLNVHGHERLVQSLAHKQLEREYATGA